MMSGIPGSAQIEMNRHLAKLVEMAARNEKALNSIAQRLEAIQKLLEDANPGKKT